MRRGPYQRLLAIGSPEIVLTQYRRAPFDHVWGTPADTQNRRDRIVEPSPRAVRQILELDRPALAIQSDEPIDPGFQPRRAEI